METISKVIKQEVIRVVADLAHKIWNDHFTPIIGQEQVDYMLDNFQSYQAITKQIADGYEYFLLYNDTNPAGYMALLSESNKLMISKIYVKKDVRGKGYGAKLLQFALNSAKQRKLNSVWLTVNRFNKNTIEWYLKKGFVVIDEVKKDIGNGFYMDDYIMEIKIK